MTQQEIESKLQVIKNNKMLPEKQKGMLIDKYEKMLSDLLSTTETEKKLETQKPKSTKIKQKIVIDESCDDLREEAKERKARALAAAEKRKNAPKKSETTRNKEAIEKASERVENSINRRVKTKSVNVDEIEDLIDEYEEAIEKLKELLDLAKKSKMKYGGGIDNKEVEKLVLNARGIKDNHCGCNDKMRRGGYTTEMKYVNKNEDYEVRYAKNKNHRRGYNSSNKMADGGVIGESIRFKDWRGNVRTGEIVSILRNGDYEVSTDRGMALVTNDEIVKMRKGGSIPKGTYLSEAGMSKKMAKGGKTEKFFVDDVVYNKRTKTIGIVRLEDERGETKTDSDGNVNTSELQDYNPIKYPNQKDAKVAPSTAKEIEERGLFNPFKIKELGGSMSKGGSMGWKHKMARGGSLKLNGVDFSFLLEMSDKELVKRLDLIRKQQLINGNQYMDARQKGESTTKIEESGNNLAMQERAIIEARLRKNKMAKGGDIIYLKSYWSNEEDEKRSEEAFKKYIKTHPIKNVWIGYDKIDNFKFDVDDYGRMVMFYALRKNANLKYYINFLHNSIALKQNNAVFLQDKNYEDFENKLLTKKTIELLNT